MGISLRKRAFVCEVGEVPKNKNKTVPRVVRDGSAPALGRPKDPGVGLALDLLQRRPPIEIGVIDAQPGLEIVKPGAIGDPVLNRCAKAGRIDEGGDD